MSNRCKKIILYLEGKKTKQCNHDQFVPVSPTNWIESHTIPKQIRTLINILFLKEKKDI